MKKITKKQIQAIKDEIQVSKSNLIFEDLASASNRTIKWLASKDDFAGLKFDADVNINISSKSLSILLKFANGESLAFSLYGDK